MRGIIVSVFIISIHAPREGSDELCWNTCERYKAAISIHAPREGSDIFKHSEAPQSALFLSTLPARGATLTAPSFTAPASFLSTLPARGATYFTVCVVASHQFLSTLPARGATLSRHAHRSLCRISIHAPREGSDAGFVCSLTKIIYFYPRSPRGERLRKVTCVCLLREISIHAPREGSDSDVVGHGNRHDISIHAPREGSDAGGDGMINFLGISIHAPREGSDVNVYGRTTGISDFYPRSPRGERQARRC